MIGRYFVGDFSHQWQGQIVEQVEPGYYLVRLHSWGHGWPTDEKVVHIADMKDWTFFEDEEDWRRQGDKMGDRWERIRLEQEKMRQPPPPPPDVMSPNSRGSR